MRRIRPRSSVLVEIPDCPMKGSITMDREILFILGWPKEDAVLVFKRPALERFVLLANELLAVPLPDDPKVDLPILTAPGV